MSIEYFDVQKSILLCQNLVWTVTILFQNTELFKFLEWLTIDYYIKKLSSLTIKNSQKINVTSGLSDH